MRGTNKGWGGGAVNCEALSAVCSMCGCMNGDVIPDRTGGGWRDAFFCVFVFVYGLCCVGVKSAACFVLCEMPHLLLYAS